MIKSYFIAALLLISSKGFSDRRHNSNFHIEGISVKTDVLPLLNSAINKGYHNYFISGELYFNNEFSLSFDFANESSSLQESIRKGNKFGSQFRWYFKQDDCNCSAFFAGTYLNFVNTTQTIDQNLQQKKEISFGNNYFEGGITGGLEEILSMHFVIDPAVQIGIEFPHEIHNESNRFNTTVDKEKVILVKILLGIGYRF